MPKTEKLISVGSDFSSSVELDDAIEAGSVPDILLLDICMPVVSGIALARKIRNWHLSSKIIFLTSPRDYAVEAFAVEASHYLVKPFTKKDFADALGRALESFKADPKKIALNTGSGMTQLVGIDYIIYIEGQGYSRVVHTRICRKRILQRADGKRRLSLEPRCGRSTRLRLRHCADYRIRHGRKIVRGIRLCSQ